MTARTRAALRSGSSVALAASALAALAACSSGTASSGASASADSGALKSASGTWTESGDYQTPGGTESVEVTLTAKDGTVSAVKVTGSGDSPNAQRYQAQFESGIQDAVVGKPLATLQVGAVSGSSLTGDGFNAAVDKIRADAA